MNSLERLEASPPMIGDEAVVATTVEKAGNRTMDGEWGAARFFETAGAVHIAPQPEVRMMSKEQERQPEGAPAPA
jgi:hypothetical protein